MRILETYERCPNGGKVRYPSRDVALEVARDREKASGLRMKVYRCSVCKGLHLSSHFVNREAGSSAFGAQIPIVTEEVTPMASAPAPAPAQAARSFPKDRGITAATLEAVTHYTKDKPARGHTIHGQVIRILGDGKVKADTVHSTLARLLERGQIGATVNGRERWYYAIPNAPAARPVGRPSSAPRPTGSAPATARPATPPPAPAVEPPPPPPVVEAPAPTAAAPLPQIAELEAQTTEAVALMWRCMHREREAWQKERAALLADRDRVWAAERAALVAERDAALELAQQLEDKIRTLRAALG